MILWWVTCCHTILPVFPTCSIKFLSLIIVSFVIALAACTKAEPAKNPDPNHTHADFAVWIEGKQIDFSGDAYMSGSSTDETHAGALHDYYHLHDKNGRVIHRHKPGLPLSDFFAALPGMRYQGTIFQFIDCLACQHAAGKYPVKLFVNGEEELIGSGYVFQDGDKILITDATDPVELRKQIRMISDDACLYSRTCPERGDPPSENCIADPTVPCVGS